MRDFLNNLSIYDLRSYGSHVGVKYPTTYRKKELIEQINLVLDGKIEPFVKSKQGRRPKKRVSMFENNNEILIKYEIDSVHDFLSNVSVELDYLKSKIEKINSIILNFIK